MPDAIMWINGRLTDGYRWEAPGECAATYAHGGKDRGRNRGRPPSGMGGRPDGRGSGWTSGPLQRAGRGLDLV